MRNWAFLGSIFSLFGSIRAAQGLINVKIDENTKVGSTVAELRNWLDSSTPLNVDLQFRIVSQDRQNGLEIFEIEGSQGQLKVKQSPDREILCPNARITDGNCKLEIQVMTTLIKEYNGLL